MSKVLGVKCSGHDTGAALIADGRIVAIAEERLNRIKHSFNAFPHLSIRYCLDALALKPADIDLVVTDKVGLRSDSLMRNRFDGETKGQFRTARLEVINHHDAHAASAFFASPFEEAAVLVYDGSGERSLNHHGVYTTETETLYRGLHNRLEEFHKTTHARVGQNFFYSFGVGKLYSFLSNVYLDFGPYNQGKMMGLAPYGDLSLLQTIPEERWFAELNGHILCNPHFVIPPRPDESLFRRLTAPTRHAWRIAKRGLTGPIRQAARFLNHGLYRDPALFTPIRLPKPIRSKQDVLPDQYYASVARAGQYILEQIAIRLGKKLRSLSGSDNLCIAGGLGLNIDANRNFLDKVGFERLFIQPGASDTGVPLGCALWGCHMALEQGRFYEMKHAYLGRPYTAPELQAALDKFAETLTYSKIPSIAKEAAALLSQGKIIAWFEGGSEYGPRALGHRSILADPRRTDAKDVLNRRVKHREHWRPFGAAILKNKLNDCFELEHDSPFMLLAANARPHVREQIPSVLHVDNTTRIQTVTKDVNGRFFDLVDEFHRLTRVPMVLNTSFNLAGDPIVETPEDALRTFASTDMDYLVIEDCLIEKKDGHMQMTP
jgi:carbamoyltransferase